MALLQLGFKDKAIIIEERSGGHHVKVLKAKAFRKGGGNYQLELGDGSRTLHVSSEYITNLTIPSKLGGNRSQGLVFLYSPEKDIYLPITLSELKNTHIQLDEKGQPMKNKDGQLIRYSKFNVISQETREFYAREIEAAYQDYLEKASGWEKWKPQITLAFVGLFIILMLYLAFDSMIPVMQSIASSNTEVANALARVAEIYRPTGGTVLS